MKHLLAAALLVWSSLTFSAERPVRFDFQAAKVAQVIGLVYMEALRQPYVIDPAVLEDNRLVSFRFDSSKGDLRAFWRAFLDSLGFTLETRNGIDFVFVQKKQDGPKAAFDHMVYRPRYRSASYLVDLLSALFRQGAFTVQRSVSPVEGEKGSSNPPSGSASDRISRDADTLIFQGTPEEVTKLKQLLPQVDVSPGEVMVSGVVYEVSTKQTDGSAFSLAMSLLGGKLSVNFGVKTLDNSIKFSNASIDAVLSALATDTRFKVVTAPRLRVRSGATSRLIVGQDVPTLGSVSYAQGNPTPVQSVEYRSAGIIFDLMPTIRDRTIELDVGQQLSNFVKTETGVNDSPTLIKRELKTSVNVENGEIIILGGLTEDKETDGSSGLSFLPRWLNSRSSDKSRTELLLVLQLTRLSSP
ncbi:type II secretion system protein GspD [Vogesella mureinivorans]|uniref:type II secretion system protein GspD n=1 Tax=Vogesella mureinivorans TaxID=657276 RepID=UPI0011CB65F6|nr:type II secretory pathway protein [Vogesella mureinivorans]